MANGCVIVTTNQGGIPDIVKDGVNGFIWRHDHTILAELILKASNHCVEIGALNMQEAKRRFTERGFIEKLSDILKSL